MTRLIQLGVLLSLRFCANAAVLEKIECDQKFQLTCMQGQSDCRVQNGQCLSSQEYVVLDVRRLELKALLCCKGGRDCRPCLQIHIHLTVTVSYDGQNHPDDYSDDVESAGRGMAEGSNSYHTMAHSTSAACLTVHYTTPNMLSRHKLLEFTLPPIALEDHGRSEVWLALVVSDEISFGSLASVFVQSTHQNITMPSENDVCSPALTTIVSECDVPMLRTTIYPEKGVAVLQLENKDVNHSSSVSMCLKYGDMGECRYQEWVGTEEITIPLHSVAYCLCIEAWWRKPDALRIKTCPFVNYTELNNVSMSVVPNLANGDNPVLSWDLTSPCRMAELWLCNKRSGGAGQGCVEVNGSRMRLMDDKESDWHENSYGHWSKKGVFVNVVPHPSLCVQVKLQGTSGDLGPWCPFEFPRRSWNFPVLVSVLLICLAILGSCLLQRSLRGVVKGGHVLLLYPPEADATLMGLVSRLGSSLLALGFSVSLDLWSQRELCALGPVPWFHTQLEHLQRHGGKVVLVLTPAACQRAQEWGQRGEKGAALDEKSDPYRCLILDVFSASLSCILADQLQGSATKRFVLTQFDSLPCLHLEAGKKKVPQLFRDLPMYSLPSKSLDFLRELMVTRGGPGHLCHLGGPLARGLRSLGSSGTLLKSGLSQDSAVSGLETMWETMPLQPSLLPPESSSGGIHWV